MDREVVIRKIQDHAKDGVIACKQALRISVQEGIPSREIGALLNELEITIASCQLGCSP